MALGQDGPGNVLPEWLGRELKVVNPIELLREAGAKARRCRRWWRESRSRP